MISVRQQIWPKGRQQFLQILQSYIVKNLLIHFIQYTLVYEWKTLNHMTDMAAQWKLISILCLYVTYKY